MNNKGFTLIELFITILVIAIVLGISTFSVFTLIAKTKLNSAISSTKSLLKEAKSYASTKSSDITVTFGSNGVTVNDSNGNRLNSIDFENKIIFDSGNSLQGNTITYNYKGSPVGTDGTIESFGQYNNGRITLCYTHGSDGACKFSKTMYVSPVTGVVTIAD